MIDLADTAQTSVGNLTRTACSGAASAADMLDAHLAAIDCWEPETRAWVHVDKAGARRQAESLARLETRGPLHGVPVGVKDVIDVAGLPTLCNSPIPDRGPVAADAAVVQRLRAAGAIILGKTVTTEFAFMSPGPTTNPQDPKRTPGGSSSGSAAAVATGMCAAALTTQTGGSTIRPAAYCGVFGYKPPLGAAPLSGLAMLAPSLDTIGVHARSIEGLASVASVIEHRPISIEAHTPDLIVRVRSALEADVEPAMERAVAGAFQALSKDGVRCLEREVSILHDLDRAHRVIMASEVAQCFADIHRGRRDDLSDSLRDFVERGRAVSSLELAASRATVHHARSDPSLSTGPDGPILILPSALGEAPIGLASTGSSVLNRCWSLLGLGVVTIPIGLGPNGLPLGLQVVDTDPLARRLFPAAAWIAETLEAAALPPRHGETENSAKGRRP